MWKPADPFANVSGCWGQRRGAAIVAIDPVTDDAPAIGGKIFRAKRISFINPSPCPSVDRYESAGKEAAHFFPFFGFLSMSDRGPMPAAGSHQMHWSNGLFLLPFFYLEPKQRRYWWSFRASGHRRPLQSPEKLADRAACSPLDVRCLPWTQRHLTAIRP